MKLTDLRIGTRLGLAFGITLLLMCTLAAVSLGGLRSFNEDVSAITQSRIPMMLDLQQMITITRAQAVMERDALISKDPQVVAANLQSIDGGHAALAKAVSEIERLLVTDQGKQLWANIGSARQTYLSSRTEVIADIKGGHADDGQQKLLSEQVPRENDYLNAVQALIDYTANQVNTERDVSAASYVNGRDLVMVLTALAVAAGAICSVLVTRSIVRPLRAAVDAASKVAQGQLRMRVDTESRDETGQLLQSLLSMTESLAGTVGEIRAGAEQVMTGAQQIARGNDDLSERTEEQASSLQETAASMEQLSTTVKQNAEGAKRANELAAKASSTAARGGQVVNKVVETMQGISASSQKVVDIISVIEGIAFQTNILALNAAVEAARAGEQGRGFAVVAGEVRSLAQRSAGAAKEIKELIEESVGRVANGTELVAETGQTMEEIVSSVRHVAAIISEIASASGEQTAGIDQVSLAVSQMDQATQQNAALVEQAAAAAQSLEQQAANLRNAVAVFKTSETHPDAFA
jgi:methyl-accepting chemotaxis protein